MDPADGFGFDSDHVAAAKTGDERALTTIYRAMHPRLLRYLRSLGRDDADDVAATAWMQFAGALASLGDDDPETARRMLFTIARRRRVDEIRRRSRQRVDPVGDVTDLGPVEVEESPEARLDDALALLRRLPDQQAEVIALRVIGGFSAAEVGELTGQTEGAVRVMAHRGLRRLRDLLEPVGRAAQESPPAVTPVDDDSMNGAS